MPSNQDHVADVATGGVELRRLANLYSFPDFVKSAGQDNLQPNGRQPITVYADPVRRQFPCHTKASTWLSFLFYKEKRAEFHPKDRVEIDKRFDGFRNYWKIATAFKAIDDRWNELHKTAEEQLPDSAFAYVWAGDNGTKDRRLPLRTAAEVKAAAEYLHQYRDNFAFPDRQRMATKILAKAASFGAMIHDRVDFLEQQAGRGVCDPSEVVAMLRERALLVPDTVVKSAEDDESAVTLRGHFNKMAETVATLPRQALQPGMLLKLAETIDQLDRNHNFVSRYERGLVRPEEVLFKATFTKTAKDLHSLVTTTSGKVYEKTALSKLSAADLQALFGSEFLSSVTTPLGDIDTEKMAEQAAALPRPDAELLDNLLSDQGITPLMRKAASAGHGLTSEEQKAWAAAYTTV